LCHLDERVADIRAIDSPTENDTFLHRQRDPHFFEALYKSPVSTDGQI
jgi:hypothetical protein